MRQALGPGALGRPRGSRWRGRWEGGSGWGIHVNPWLFHFSIWQNSLPKKKKASILQHLVFFVVQLSHPYMTTGKMSVVLKKWPQVISVNYLHFNDCLHSLSFDSMAPLTNINRVTKISHLLFHLSPYL